MRTARDCLDAIADAAAVVNHATAMLPDGAPLATVSEQLDLLSRAVARAQVLITVEPDAVLDKPLDGPVFTDQDRADRAMTIDALEVALSMPSSPVTVRMRVRHLGDETKEDAIRRWLDHIGFTAVPDGHGYAIDGNRFVAEPAERFLDPDDRS